MLPKMTFNYPELSHFILRVVVGFVFIYHGAQKLFGAFGGHGMDGFIGFLVTLQVPYAGISGWMAALTEFFCGMALVFGIYARWVALPLIGVMCIAVIFVTGGKGFGQGYEYNVVLIAALAAIFLQGPGKWGIKN